MGAHTVCGKKKQSGKEAKRQHKQSRFFRIIASGNYVKDKNNSYVSCKSYPNGNDSKRK